MQLDAFATKQLNGGQANRVWTPRRSGGKHTMWPIVRGWSTNQFGPMQFVAVLMQFGSAQFELRGAIELVTPGSLPNDGKIIADERLYT